jgi:amidase
MTVDASRSDPGAAPVDRAAASLVATLLESRGDAEAVSARLKNATTRADEIEPSLKAFSFRPALDSSAYAALATTPLAGIPVAIKDLMDTADMPTTYGSAIHRNHQPTEDAWITQRIREYGGVVFGKTVTTEFAWREPGPTVNPWNPLHTPGGSSSGSAAAVGAGIVPLATGTQTVGSVIRPAAYCGVVGYKPSYGRIPTTGVHPLSRTLDHVGFFAKTVEDAALAHALFIEGKPEAVASEQTWRDYFGGGVAVPQRRFAVVRTPLWDKVSKTQQDNFNACLEKVTAAGASLVEITFDAMPEVLAGVMTLLAVEANEDIGEKARANPSLVSAHLAQLTAEGAAMPSAHYRAAVQLRTRLRDGFKAFLQGCDGILTIPATGEAPSGLSYTGDPSFCAPWSFLGAPAVTVPSGFSPAGLPLGLQIVGDIDNDLATLQAAAWIENLVG